MVDGAGSAVRNFPNVVALDSFGYFQIYLEVFYPSSNTVSLDYFSLFRFLFLSVISSCLLKLKTSDNLGKLELRLILNLFL